MPGCRVRYWSGWALILALALGGPAAGQPAEPILRIETGGHVAAVGDAATDAAGRLLVTVSSDKTARIWSLPDLRPIGVIRPRIAENEVGQLNAVAVSPDGRLAAVGGWLGQQARDGVLLVDIETRQVVRQLSGLPDTVAALAFSSDGRRLAAGFGTSGIRLFRVSDGRQVSEDRDYRGQVLGLDFAPDGRLAAAAADGDLRLYDVAGRRARQMRLEAGQRPRRIRFSPDGRLIAVGSASSLAVEVRDGMTLALRARPDLGGLPRKDGPVDLNMPNVAWSADGRTLYAGGALFGERPPLFAWGEAGAGPRRVVDPGTINPISQILGLRDGGLVFASVYGEMVTLDRDGIRQAEVGQSTGDLANLPGNWHLPARRLGVSPDGRIVEWVFFDGRNAWLRFDAASHEFTAGAPPLDGLFDWTPEAAGLFLTGWDYGERPALNRQGLRLDRGDRSYSAAVAPERVLLGTEWSLLMFDGDGRRLWARPVPDNANRVNQSPDGRLVVAALGDGTIRWYRSRDGEELLALFVTPDAERWVAFTPTGYYAASPGGEDLIGWHLNRGPDQAADFFGAGRFRDRFYRPDVIERVLTTLDIGQALEQADLARGKRTEAAPDLRQDLPPVVTILSPSDGSSLSGGEAAIRYRLRSPSGQPVREIRVLIDGRPAPVMRGLDRESLRQDGGALQEIERQVTVQIPPGRSVTVTLLAEANGRLSEPARLRLTGAVPAAPAAAPPLPMAAAPAVAIPTSPAAPNPLAPRLNAVLVGVSDYADPTLRLGFAAKDARDLAAALAAQRDLGLYREVNLRVLTDRDATRGGVLDALDWLRRQTTSNDVALVFLAGHGMPDEGRTFFLPADGDPERLFSTAVAQTDLQGILSRVPGRVVALVDICHAGSAVLAQNQRGIRTAPDMTAFVNQLREPGSGLIVFAGATSRQPAVELPALGNGAFTAALLEGLGGAADLNRDGAVRTDELNVFVADRVRALTNGRQHPVMQRPGDVPDFPLLAARR